MKIGYLPALASLAFAAGPVIAQDMGDMKHMPGMMHDMPAARTGQGTGVITAIDAKAGKLTIKHDPIAAIGWPAMTMTFKASPPTLLNAVRIGQTIAFDVKAQGMSGEVTAIRPR